jgi:hypothetical protein
LFPPVRLPVALLAAAWLMPEMLVMVRTFLVKPLS